MKAYLDTVRENNLKFVLVSGGVISGIGKGLTASSLGVLLKSCGWRITAIKIDPYLNIDAGTMSPFEHGEVFVLDDGGEVDLDLGNYERFLDITLTRDNNITTGKIYSQVLEKERKGSYLGKTVQVVPHITDAIQEWIMRVATTPDQNGLVPEICVIELGGTVGDIESMPFVEALRQLRYNVGDVNFCSVFVSLVPILGVVGEQKTKPTQHGVKSITSMGLSPQLIVCRSEVPLLPETKKKLALFCQVAPDAVASVHDVSNTYRIPLMLQEQGVCNLLIRTLHLVWRLPHRLEKWARMAAKADEQNENVTICIVGKYTDLSDAYLSVIRALRHAGMALGRHVKVTWVESTDLETINGEAANTNKNISSPLTSGNGKKTNQQTECSGPKLNSTSKMNGSFKESIDEKKNPAWKALVEADGILLAVVESVRHSYSEPKANSAEIDEDAPVKAVIYMPEVDKTKMGGTMRLGARKTVIQGEECIASWLYGKTEIYERHRHRYEVNPDVVSTVETSDCLQFVGVDSSGERMEILESKGHPFFFGTQFHPEFTSRPGRPSPPFVGFVMAAAKMSLTRESVVDIMSSIRSEDPWAEEVADSGR
ncbi:CTP synthase 1 [Gracilariopsis chorda]|uniref:CTP synthase n=1 Tax=Gracilariopsis chorda TaxID=448386 RepID=A0A2V3ISJ9_9FLOR|nr:CTP synthase 1 [Gracilariopsis chorda]|eukprot:PXF45093.1 CTP synthase 1 [Gracilariopsis chorda]